MNDLRTAAQQALEALYQAREHVTVHTDGPWQQVETDCHAAITALLAALAQQDEPVAYTTGHCENHKQKGGCQLHNLQCGWPDCDRKPTTAPPQQVEPVQEPAFHGFMSDDGTQVDVCFSPSAPRRDGTYATAYYTAPPHRVAQQAEPLNLSDPAVQKRLASQWGYVPAAAQAEPVEPVVRECSDPMCACRGGPCAECEEGEREKEIEDLRSSLYFYQRRCEALQSWQSKMRDPERTIVCDILANGKTLDPALAGDRYTTPQPAEPVEPVAWMFELARNFDLYGYGGWEKRITEYRPNTPEGSVRNVTPLYTAPPQRTMVPLTEKEMYAVDEEARKNFRLSQKGPRGQQITYWDGLTPWLIRAVERAHGIKEN